MLKYYYLLLKLKFQRKRIFEIDLINGVIKLNGKPLKKRILNKIEYVWVEMDPDGETI